MTQRDVPEIRKIAGILSDLAAQKLREKQVATKVKPAPSLKMNKKGSAQYDDMGSADDFDAFDEL